MLIYGREPLLAAAEDHSFDLVKLVLQHHDAGFITRFFLRAIGYFLLI
jgi:hypothetical protein